MLTENKLLCGCSLARLGLDLSILHWPNVDLICWRLSLPVLVHVAGCHSQHVALRAERKRGNGGGVAGYLQA